MTSRAIFGEKERLRLGVIACGVLEWNLRQAAVDCGHELRFDFLPGGLHANPATLNKRLQAAIDAMDKEWQLDGIIIGYGLCGRGVARITARRAPLAIPRCEDCTAIFLGSQRRYREEFTRYPGTFYHSVGWLRGKGRKRFGTRRNRSLYDLEFARLVERFGEENAHFIVDFRASWKGNYQRAAYISFEGDPEREAHVPRVEALAAAEGWAFHELRGSEELFRRLAAGDWETPDILVVRPGEMIVPAPGAEVMSAGVDATAAYRRALQRFRKARRRKREKRSGLALGIDAGGTYTDSVVYDFAAGQVLSKAKAPTTHDDLAVGIRESVAGLDGAALRQVTRVALSTTLATNAIVEGKGQRVGLLLMGIGDEDLARLQFRYKRLIPGRLSMEGHEIEPLDLAAAAAAVRALCAEGVRAFAVSGYAATVEPRHEIEIARLVREQTGLPVICGHELTRSLNLYNRANTAALNARLLPLIHDLIRSVRGVLAEFGLENVRMMVVRGDGTQLLDRCAERVPVETLLSGPAASVVGALVLSRRRDALVADMGGTTLDIALVRDGEPVLDAAGARVGGFRTSVQAMMVNTIGLGCDSEIHFKAWPRLGVGPRRVLPLAVLAARDEQVARKLEELAASNADAGDDFEPMVFLLRHQRHEPPGLSERERATLAALDGRAASLGEIARRIGAPSSRFVPVEHLEGLGLVLRAGVTPTDLLHVEGLFERYSVRAARAAFTFHARRLRVSVEELCDAVWLAVRRGIVRELLRVELGEEGQWTPEDRSAEFVVDHLFAGEQPGTRFSLRLGRPVVPIGAPVTAFFPALARVLGSEVFVPEHVEVANAVGAVAAEVALSEQVEIVAAADGAFQVQSRLHSRRFFRFQEALDDAERLIRASLEEQARDNDVAFGEPDFIVQERVSESTRGPIFLGVRLTGRLLV